MPWDQCLGGGKKNEWMNTRMHKKWWMTNRFMPIFPTENIYLYLYLCMFISDTWISVLWSSTIIELWILFKMLINKIEYMNILIIVFTVDCHKWSFVWHVPDSPYPWQRGCLLSEMWYSTNIMHYLYGTSHFPMCHWVVKAVDLCLKVFWNSFPWSVPNLKYPPRTSFDIRCFFTFIMQ